jgi:hypothetical protein
VTTQSLTVLAVLVLSVTAAWCEVPPANSDADPTASSSPAASPAALTLACECTTAPGDGAKPVLRATLVIESAGADKLTYVEVCRPASVPQLVQAEPSAPPASCRYELSLDPIPVQVSPKNEPIWEPAMVKALAGVRVRVRVGEALHVFFLAPDSAGGKFRTIGDVTNEKAVFALRATSPTVRQIGLPELRADVESQLASLKKTVAQQESALDAMRKQSDAASARKCPECGGTTQTNPIHERPEVLVKNGKVVAVGKAMKFDANGKVIPVPPSAQCTAFHKNLKSTVDAITARIETGTKDRDRLTQSTQILAKAVQTLGK